MNADEREGPPTEAERLARDQAEREARERALGEVAGEPAEAQAHERRAEKADYLRRKLEERDEAEQEEGGP